MKEMKRRDEAEKAAELYAPKPQSTILIYGLVSICICGLALIAFGRFYSVDVLQYPLAVARVFIAIFVAGMVLHRSRSGRHTRAHRAEYQNTELTTAEVSRRSQVELVRRRIISGTEE